VGRLSSTDVSCFVTSGAIPYPNLLDTLGDHRSVSSGCKPCCTLSSWPCAVPHEFRRC
jgi:hypothetical protein